MPCQDTHHLSMPPTQLDPRSIETFRLTPRYWRRGFYPPGPHQLSWQKWLIDSEKTSQLLVNQIGPSPVRPLGSRLKVVTQSNYLAAR
jgi:hypothetical protein